MKKWGKYSLVVLIMLSALSCNKMQENTTINVMRSMLIEKTWFLNYSVSGSSTKNYVGQITYFITFYKDGTTKDSDGLTGTYTLVNNNEQYELHVSARSPNGNTVSYVHILQSVGGVNMVQSFIPFGQTTKTTQYYSSK